MENHPSLFSKKEIIGPLAHLRVTSAQLYGPSSNPTIIAL